MPGFRESLNKAHTFVYPLVFNAIGMSDGTALLPDIILNSNVKTQEIFTKAKQQAMAYIDTLLSEFEKLEASEKKRPNNLLMLNEVLGPLYVLVGDNGKAFTHLKSAADYCFDVHHAEYDDGVMRHGALTAAIYEKNGDKENAAIYYNRSKSLGLYLPPVSVADSQLRAADALTKLDNPDYEQILRCYRDAIKFIDYTLKEIPSERASVPGGFDMQRAKAAIVAIKQKCQAGLELVDKKLQ
jgi:tetratricopeptide (TPR) repeat protein